ncbi:MAG: NAD(P)/FAD-dependent oxidoreductase [Parvibaculaceae bacterium]
MDNIECVVVGAGAVGLACARALALRGHEVLVLERHEAIGTEVSARNSEVIHAGIYYPAGSVRAKLCVEGRIRLHDYMQAHHVPHKHCGKLIVATSKVQLGELANIAARARTNGVDDLREVSGAEARAMEPALNAYAALVSPSTGILDAHAYMLALRGDIEDHSGAIAFGATLTGAEALRDGFILTVGGMKLKCRMLVNSAGLSAPALARAIDGLDAAHVPQEHFAKGNYFALAGRAPFSRLIYPVPEAAGLGVHLTLDMGGQARFGPDVEWITPANADDIDYAVDPARGEIFYEAIRRYWPALKDGALTPAYAGARPKIHGPDEAAADFVISGPQAHGLAGLVNLFGIESPGLTSSLAIADTVANMLCD